MVYTDYKGNELSPNKDSIVKNRSGIWAAIIDPENRILISHPNFDLQRIEIPGGGIDDGENKKQALIREVSEETGVVFKDLTPNKTSTQHIKYYAEDVAEFWNYNQEHWVINLENISKYFEGTKTTQEGALGEWINISEIKPDNFHHTHFEAMKKIGIL